jgi:sulfane dehydrogenase subunit SoxC
MMVARAGPKQAWMAVSYPSPHTRFRFPWTWNGQEAILQSRAADETGFVQPSREALVAARGTNSIYHYNGIQSWKVAANSGRLTNYYAS